VDPADLKKMCDCLYHRGPDDEGYYFMLSDGSRRVCPNHPGDALESSLASFAQPVDSIAHASVGLGHRRLSILDLSEAGHQPMCSEDGRFWITYNGEIYNYRELKKELISLGHRFCSSTDTEVVLHAFEEWGESCVTRFNGMWAFAVWDEKSRSLFLSRDRFGIKPLYFFQENGVFVFASEIKSILAVRPDQRLPNLPYISNFLAYGLMDHRDETFFRNIRAIPPAHSMTVTCDKVTIRRYWEIVHRADTVRAEFKSVGDRHEAFRQLLEDAVRIRLLSDAPLGACLSGGLDSSSIVSLATGFKPKLPTFSSFFSGNGCDESAFAKEMTRLYHTEDYWIEPDVGEFFDLLPRMIWHQDEPGTAYGIFPQWKIMELAAGHVRVLLDGQGGDELLGGYLHFMPHYLKTVMGDSKADDGDFKRARKEIGEQYGASMARPFETGQNSDEEYRWAIVNPELKKDAPSVQRDFQGPFTHHLDNVLFFSLTRDILPGLLHYQDRMSMAFSIESRVPFLDYRLVEFCFQLPYHEKIDKGVTKSILRRAMNGRLPESVRMRRDKLGFPAPLASWIRSDLNDPIRDTLFSGKLKQRGIIDTDVALDRFSKHAEGKADYTWEIWRWLSLEIWFREFVD
jgi:asparagine synthase (glutamine-hydrolysing)